MLVIIAISLILIYNQKKYNKNNLPQSCGDVKLSEPFEPYDGSYTNGFSINNVLCSNLDVSKNLNTTADIKSTGNVIVKSIDNIKIQEETNKEAKTLLQILYPIGCIYISTNSTDPSTFIGGTWEQITDKFLWCGNSKSTALTTGGADNVTLTTDNLPSHNHTFAGNSMEGTINKILSYSYNNPFLSNEKDKGTSSNVFKTVKTITDYVNNSQGVRTETNITNFKFEATPSGTISNTGGGKSFSIIPPYITVFAWRRTA